MHVHTSKMVLGYRGLVASTCIMTHLVLYTNLLSSLTDLLTWPCVHINIHTHTHLCWSWWAGSSQIINQFELDILHSVYSHVTHLPPTYSITRVHVYSPLPPPLPFPTYAHIRTHTTHTYLHTLPVQGESCDGPELYGSADWALLCPTHL